MESVNDSRKGRRRHAAEVNKIVHVHARTNELEELVAWIGTQLGRGSRNRGKANVAAGLGTRRTQNEGRRRRRKGGGGCESETAGWAEVRA
jgi:hypothetical protein